MNDRINGGSNDNELLLDKGVKIDAKKDRGSELQIVSADQREQVLYQLDFVNHLVGKGYERDLEALKNFKFYDYTQQSFHDKAHPSEEWVAAIVKANVSPAQAEIIRMMREPIFQLVPVTNYDRYTDVFTNFRSLCEVGWIAKAWDNYDGNKSRNNWAAIKDWDIAITDDSDDLLEGDQVDLPLSERVKWFEEKFGRFGFEGMDFRTYMMMAMSNMGPDLNKGAFKTGGNTVLNGVPVFEDKIVVGSMYMEDGFVNLRRIDPSRVVQNVSFKPSLVMRGVSK